MYLAHFRGLWPGAKVPSFRVHPDQPGDISGWQNDDCQALIEEGRRQLDAQRDQAEQIRGRAQFLFTTAIGLAAVSFAGKSAVFAAKSDAPLAIWSLGLLLTTLGLLGTASVIVARKEFGSIDAAVMTTTYSLQCARNSPPATRVRWVGEPIRWRRCSPSTETRFSLSCWERSAGGQPGWPQPSDERSGESIVHRCQGLSIRNRSKTCSLRCTGSPCWNNHVNSVDMAFYVATSRPSTGPSRSAKEDR